MGRDRRDGVWGSTASTGSARAGLAEAVPGVVGEVGAPRLSFHEALTSGPVLPDLGRAAVPGYCGCRSLHSFCSATRDRPQQHPVSVVYFPPWPQGTERSLTRLDPWRGFLEASSSGIPRSCRRRGSSGKRPWRSVGRSLTPPLVWRCETYLPFARCRRAVELSERGTVRSVVVAINERAA